MVKKAEKSEKRQKKKGKGRGDRRGPQIDIYGYATATVYKFLVDCVAVCCEIHLFIILQIAYYKLAIYCC